MEAAIPIKANRKVLVASSWGSSFPWKGGTGLRRDPKVRAVVSKNKNPTMTTNHPL
jgi:hypothetical protein